MNEAIKVLEKAEVVLMKRIKQMQDGKPKYAASERLQELRYGISLLKQAQAEGYSRMSEEEEDEFLKQVFEDKPAKARA